MAAVHYDRWGIYVRISDDKEGEAKGVARQTKDARSKLYRLGASDEQIAKVYEENDTSAFKRKRVQVVDDQGRTVTRYRVVRPVWNQFLQDLRDGVITKGIVYDLDRLARDPRDLEDAIDIVEEHRREIVGFQGDIDLTSDNGRLMARIAVAVAHKSSSDTRRRVARKHQEIAETGRTAGGIRPFGWQTDKITIKEDEAVHLRRWIDMAILGHSWGDLEKDATARGLVGTYGKPLRKTTIREMVKNPRICGWRMYHNEIILGADGNPVQGIWQPLVTTEKYQQLVATRGRSRVPVTHRAVHQPSKYLLVGLLYCGKCGARLRQLQHKTMSKAGQVKEWRNYVCPATSAGGCGGVARDLVKTEEAVMTLIREHLRRNPDGENVTAGDNSDLVLHQLGENEAERARIVADYSAKQITLAVMTELLEACESREQDLRARISMVDTTRTLRETVPTEKFSETEWTRLSTTEQRHLIRLVTPGFKIMPSSTRSGTYGRFDYEAIVPIGWR